jgi:hypothetical protein
MKGTLGMAESFDDTGDVVETELDPELFESERGIRAFAWGGFSLRRRLDGTRPGRRAARHP